MPDMRRQSWPAHAPVPRGARLGRRGLLAAGLAVGMFARRAGAADGPFAGGADVLVAGPAGGRLDRVADELVPALARGLPAGTALRRDLAGGPDGVTGANQFDARVAPDGASVLLMPGDAALAWLVGDPRARFSPGSLATVMAGVAPAVVMTRWPLAAIPPAASLRIAADRIAGPDLAGLLAIDLLGLRPQPIMGAVDPALAERAVRADAVDAAFVVGPDAAQRIGRLAAAGLVPAFSLGVPGEDGAVMRDPVVPELPTLPELIASRRGKPPAGPLYDAWRAVAASAQLEFLLALPALVPASLVSIWRQAAIQAVPAVGADEGTVAARILACPDASRFAAPAMSADAATLIELRRWLGSRLGWQPS